MAEEGAVVIAPEAPAQPTPEQIQNQIGMAMAFDDPSLMPQIVDPVIPPVIPEPIDTAAVIAPASTPSDNEEVKDANDYLKEQLGFDDWETAKAEIEKLKTAPKKTEIEFADEQSKKIHELIRQGKTKEVSQYLQAQELLANVDTMNDEQKLKLYIKMQNPRFDKELIDDEYNSLYSINEDDFTDDPMKLRKERLRLEQRLENDVTKAQEYFSAYTQKIQLPDIQPPTVTIDEDYNAYKASIAAADEAYDNVTVPMVKALKETDIFLGFKVDDANNQMQFDVSLTPTKEDFEKARQDSLSLNQFLAKTCYDKDGKFLPKELLSMILLKQNFGSYAQSIARQAVNEERKRVIAKEAPNGSGSRDFNVNGDMTELQKQMQFALS
jgi:hypothetical protein